ncbi:hypothetical protein ACFO0M_18455 [Micromonospora mangrovi]|uniref:Uncharacterized protein n=2 Tax=Micromonospora TaxID=1873 RepID=A0AAU8HMZ8_9ACTN
MVTESALAGDDLGDDAHAEEDEDHRADELRYQFADEGAPPENGHVPLLPGGVVAGLAGSVWRL